MGRKPIDLTGQRFGKLTALRRNGTDPGQCAMWECRCDCGGTRMVSSNRLRTGRVKSCGCMRRPSPPHPVMTITWHGETRTISDWASITQISAKLIHSRLVAGWPTDEIFGDGRKTQPCWGCKHACGGCSWSQSFIPVPGWDATETFVDPSKCGGAYKSYQIEKCPEFEPDEPR